MFDKNEPIIICPIDDLLLSGPIQGLEVPEEKIRSILSAKPSAILTFAGTIKKYYNEIKDTRTIVNLSASTTRSNYTKKVLIGSVESALRCNANAVAVHINVCSKFASDMMRDAGSIIEYADRYNIPTVGILYPRGENDDGSTNEYDDLRNKSPEEYSEIIAHCVQIGVDMGFDLIKTQYTLTPISFQKVITAAQGVPVVTAGGPLIDEDLSIQNALDAFTVGAAGTSFARNTFGRKNPAIYIQRLRERLMQSR